MRILSQPLRDDPLDLPFPIIRPPERPPARPPTRPARPPAGLGSPTDLACSSVYNRLYYIILY